MFRPKGPQRQNAVIAIYEFAHKLTLSVILRILNISGSDIVFPTPPRCSERTRHTISNGMDNKM